MSNHIDKMTDSVNRLNATMSAVITNQKSYDARIKKLEEKVD